MIGLPVRTPTMSGTIIYYLPQGGCLVQCRYSRRIEEHLDMSKVEIIIPESLWKCEWIIDRPGEKYTTFGLEDGSMLVHERTEYYVFVALAIRRGWEKERQERLKKEWDQIEAEELDEAEAG